MQHDVAEVTGTGVPVLFASEAATVIVHDAHAGVIDRVKVGLEGLLVVNQSACDLDD